MKKLLGSVFVMGLLLCLQTASVADMPLPYTKSSPNQYLTGVKRIVIWSHVAMSPSAYAVIANSLGGVITDINYNKLDTEIANNLQTSLEPYLKDKIVIETFHASNTDPFKRTDENTLLIEFNFGYRLAQLDNKNIILGAVYPTVWRLPPEQLRGDRTSGFYQGFVHGAYPFILEDGTAKKSMLTAIKWGTESVVEQLNSLLPARSKGSE